VKNASSRDEQELPGRFNLENKKAQEKETRD